MITVVIADDHPLVRDGIVAILTREPDLEVLAQGFVPEFLESIRARGAHRCYQMLWFHQAFIEQYARVRDAPPLARL